MPVLSQILGSTIKIIHCVMSRDNAIIEMARYLEAAISETIDGASAWLGYSELCESQLLAVKHFLRGKDVAAESRYVIFCY